MNIIELFEEIDDDFLEDCALIYQDIIQNN